MEVDKVDCQVKCVLWASVLPLLGKVPQLKWAVRCQGRIGRCRDIGWQRICSGNALTLVGMVALEVGLILLPLEEQTGCHRCSGLWRCRDIGRL